MSASARPVAEQAIEVVDSRAHARVKDWVSAAAEVVVGRGAVNSKERVEGPWIKVYGCANGQDEVSVSEEQAMWYVVCAWCCLVVSIS